jgi:hypothetical protein
MVAAVRIKDREFQVVENPNCNRSALDHFVEFNKKSEGTFRTLQLVERVSKAVVLILENMGHYSALFFKDLAKGCGTAWAWLTIPRLPGAIQTAYKTIRNWSTSPQGPVQKVHDLADALATCGYGIALVTQNLAFQNAAAVPDLLANATDITMAVEDLNLAHEHVKYVEVNHADNRPLKDIFVQKVRHSWIKIAKITTSIVSGILGLLVLVLGGPVLPAPVLLALGLTGTIAAMTAFFYKEACPYEMPDFFQARQVVVH